MNNLRNKRNRKGYFLEFGNINEDESIGSLMEELSQNEQRNYIILNQNDY